MIIVAAVTIAYTLFGGFMGATFTDVAQGLLMLVALIIVPIIGLVQVGGFGGPTTTRAFRAVDGDIRQYGAMANAFYDFVIPGIPLPVQPYVGAGAGYIWT